jgi:hypothetical protein
VGTARGGKCHDARESSFRHARDTGGYSRQRSPITASVRGKFPRPHPHLGVSTPAPGKPAAAVDVFYYDPNDHNKAPLQSHGDFSYAGSSPGSPDQIPPRWNHSSPFQARRFQSPILVSRGRMVPQRQKANSTIDQQHLPGRVSSPPLTRPRAQPQYPHTSALENVPVPFPSSSRPRRAARRLTAGRDKQAQWNAPPRGDAAEVPSCLAASSPRMPPFHGATGLDLGSPSPCS